MRAGWRAVALCVGLLAGAGAYAQSRIPWADLSPAQRAVLAPLAPDWRAISPAQQHKWSEVANRFGSLPPDERSRLQQRMGEWSRLSADERARARLNYQESRQLSPGQRQEQWDAYRSLPAEQRRAFVERAGKSRTPVPAAPQPVGPTVVQRGAGATTNLVSKPPRPPLHQQAGLPKVSATPGFVDSATLLPQRGAQGAAAARPSPPAKGESGKVKSGGKADDGKK
jgi:hypothetical protein